MIYVQRMDLIRRMKIFLVFFDCHTFYIAWRQFLVKLDNAKRGIPSQGGKVDLDL